eukprot:gene252-173_t
MLSTGSIPDYLTKARIIPLSKDNSPFPCVGSIRCLYIQPQIFKVAEKCILKRLQAEIDDKHPIHSTQMGFKKGKGTLNNVDKLLTYIAEAKEIARRERARRVSIHLRRKQFIICTDFTHAFDDMMQDRLLAKLHSWGVSEYLVKFCANFFSQSAGTIDDVTIKTTRGSPQGSIISPCMWLCYCNDLAETLAQQDFKPLLYADDLCMSVSGDMNLIKSIKAVEHWSSLNGIKLNCAKSAWMQIIVDARTPPPNFDQCRGIKRQKTIKYLGIHVSESGNAKP